MWFLFNIVGGDGHFFPMVPLARELEAAGHEVSFVTGSDYCDRVERYGFTAPVQDVVMTGAELKERRRSMSELRGNERVRVAYQRMLKTLSRTPTASSSCAAIVVLMF